MLLFTNDETSTSFYLDSEDTLEGVEVKYIGEKICSSKCTGTDYSLILECDIFGKKEFSKVKLLNVTLEENGVAISIVCLDSTEKFHKKPYCIFIRMGKDVELTSDIISGKKVLHLTVKSNYEMTVSDVEIDETVL